MTICLLVLQHSTNDWPNDVKRVYAIHLVFIILDIMTNYKRLFISGVMATFSLCAVSAGSKIYDFGVLTHNSLSDTELTRIFAENSYVILDFYATWCTPCTRVSKVLSNIINSRRASDQQLVIIKIDIEKFPQLSQRYNVRSVPTLVFIKNGTEVVSHRIVGAIDQKKLVVKIKEIF